MDCLNMLAPLNLSGRRLQATNRLGRPTRWNYPYWRVALPRYPLHGTTGPAADAQAMRLPAEIDGSRVTVNCSGRVRLLRQLRRRALLTQVRQRFVAQRLAGLPC